MIKIQDDWSPPQHRVFGIFGIRTALRGVALNKLKKITLIFIMTELPYE